MKHYQQAIDLDNLQSIAEHTRLMMEQIQYDRQHAAGEIIEVLRPSLDDDGYSLDPAQS